MDVKPGASCNMAQRNLFCRVSAGMSEWNAV